jgi:hypothetical protein
VGGGALIPIALGFGVAGGLIGRMKGSSFFLWFLVSVIPPFFGFIAALLYRYDTDEPERPCPRCGKTVKLHDALCTRCGEELEYPEDAALAR